MTINETENKVRASLLGRFYFGYLRSFGPARWIAAQILIAIRYFYIIMCYCRTRTVNLLCINDFHGPTKQNEKTLYAAQTVNTPPPQVFPEKAASSIQAPHANYIFPPIKTSILTNAIVYGGSSFVGMGDHMLHHQLYNVEHDLTSEEGRMICRINPTAKKFRWTILNKNQISVPLAVSFNDGCAANYAHWLTEILPTIAVFCAHDTNETMPILINAGLHPNLLQSLRTIIGARDIIQVPYNHRVAVTSLHVVSPCGYVQFDRRDAKLDFASHGTFSPTALALLRACLLPLIKDKETPRRIYLKRNSAYRSIVNVTQIETLFEEMGFTSIEPEKLSFMEQVAMFHNADMIVGQSGAAFANIIFCKPEARIIILSADIPGSGYWYWQNMACATHNIVTFILGEASNLSNMHSNFSIDTAVLTDALHRLMV